MDDDGQLLTEKNISECDRWVGFVESLSKVKTNDHVTHDAFLRRIVNHREEKSGLDMSKTNKRTINSENCGGQCKCRFNLAKLYALSREDECAHVEKLQISIDSKVHGMLPQNLSNQQSPNLKPNASASPMPSIATTRCILF